MPGLGRMLALAALGVGLCGCVVYPADYYGPPPHHHQHGYYAPPPPPPGPPPGWYGPRPWR
ncbi:hypothetical protein EBE87_21330 [Pseudoroseomonas wenyumeiae]|uniref:Lipoprotein n=1 Tax=Teichococcus wenyumeiae TaxID=2478470 RepID=A0A3A9J9M6_9PROT|nr:hypothetical protein D6Z83_25490 [Pseudoroseomonas wenyumeiae]RMI19169.1 hypothetical protein EBE87_21330 [Pseudoroseomonas wenyumeiae]